MKLSKLILKALKIENGLITQVFPCPEFFYNPHHESTDRQKSLVVDREKVEEKY